MGGRLHQAWTAEGWLYAAAVIGLFSRRVVDRSMSATMAAELVTDAPVMAIWRRGKPEALLHHSDQGSQYTSEQFQRLMADHGVTCSMSMSGNVWDNAAVESFFSSPKAERVAREARRTRDAARADVLDRIERFYNPRRRHSATGYLSPMGFERMAGTGQTERPPNRQQPTRRPRRRILHARGPLPRVGRTPEAGRRAVARRRRGAGRRNRDPASGSRRLQASEVGRAGTVPPAAHRSPD